jgi:acetyltransferase
MMEKPVMPEPVEVVRFLNRAICLRPLRAEDRGWLEDLTRRTEQHDLQMRFLSGFRRIPPALLDELMRIDPEQRITLVASDCANESRPEILGVARAHTAAAGSAEIALLVRSDLKGNGLGSMLLDRLIARCRRRGLRVLVGDVLQQNARMLRLAEKFGFRSEPAQHGITRVVLDLKPLAA